jgi:hypothetical protein
MTSVITALFAIMAETAKSTSQPARHISGDLNALPNSIGKRYRVQLIFLAGQNAKSRAKVDNG